MRKLLSIAIILSACTGGTREDTGAELEANSNKAGNASNKSNVDEEATGGSFKTFTYSLQNSPLTSKTYDRKAAQDIAESLDEETKKPEFKNRKDLVVLMAARRFAGMGLSDVVNVAAKLVTLEIKRDPKRDLPEIAKLELVLAAVKVRKLAYAEYFLAEIRESKHKTIRAAALTAEGLIAALDGRLPEAVTSWQAALKVDNDYEPALLNLGFIALKHGDLGAARQHLGARGGDFTAQTALIAADRLTGNAAKADETCQSLLAKHKDYKPLLYNCALNQYQGLANLDKAEALLKTYSNAKIDGGPYDERAERLRMRIEDDRSRQASEAKKSEDPKASEQKSQN